jgi:hypothetical protein
MSPRLPDDPSIGPDVRLYRLVHPSFVGWNENDSRYTFSGAAFTNTPQTTEMSILLETLLHEQGRDPDDVLVGKREYHSIVALTAGLVREEGQTVAETQGDDPAHGDVSGDKDKGRRRRFSEAAEVVKVGQVLSGRRQSS